MFRAAMTRDRHERRAWRQVGFIASFVIAVGVTGALALDAAVRSLATHSDVRVIDGDTIRIGAERIRLNGIDAPELAGHCRPGRACVAGDADASKAQLAAGFAMPGRVTINRLKTDRYGRTVAQVLVGGTDLSCWQIAHDAAIYVPRWDEGNIMEGSCE